MKRSLAFTLFTAGALSLSTIACGGSSEDEALDEASGGAKSSSGGNGGSKSTGGQPSSGVGGEQIGCCLAAPVCGDGEIEVASATDCPEGMICYENSVCCSTIWCAQQIAQCDAYPVCPEGTAQVDQCPADARCSTQSICGNTIQCQELDNPPSCGGGPTCPTGTSEVNECPDDQDCQSVSFCGTTLFCVADAEGEACDPDDPHREYISDTPKNCVGIDFDCGSGLVGFEDECGCGCEQEASCPTTLDCMPGNEVDPRCSDRAQCPLSERVY